MFGVRQLAYWEDVLHKLATIPPSELSAENRINYAVYQPQIENLAAGVRFRAYEMPFNSDSQFWSDPSSAREIARWLRAK